MKAMLKKTFFAVLPLLGLLLLPVVASAHEQAWPHKRFSTSYGPVSGNLNGSLAGVCWGNHRGWYGSPRYYGTWIFLQPWLVWWSTLLWQRLQ